MAQEPRNLRRCQGTEVTKIWRTAGTTAAGVDSQRQQDNLQCTVGLKPIWWLPPPQTRSLPLLQLSAMDTRSDQAANSAHLLTENERHMSFLDIALVIKKVIVDLRSTLKNRTIRRYIRGAARRGRSWSTQDGTRWSLLDYVQGPAQLTTSKQPSHSRDICKMWL